MSIDEEEKLRTQGKEKMRKWKIGIKSSPRMNADQHGFKVKNVLLNF